MFLYKYIYIISIYNFLSIFAINHWALNDNGQILQKVDSPFYLREPNNLIAFLDQIKYNDIIESTYTDLIKQRAKMVKQLIYAIQFGMEVIEQAECKINFYKIEYGMSYAKLSIEYLKRIHIENYDKNNNNNIEFANTLPLCWHYVPLKSGICCYDHLENLKQTTEIHLKPESVLDFHDIQNENIKNDDNFKLNILNGLEENPNSWKYHTLSSYYWRRKGDAQQAIECAKRGVMLAPREYRDIPLLSLGFILFRSQKFHDAEILLTAAVDHAPQIAENHFALGITLVMLYKFNRSMEQFAIAEKLDLNFIPKTKILKKFIICLENLNIKTTKLYKNVEYVKEEVNGLKTMKSKIIQSHDKLIQQQVPLGARYFDVDNHPNRELLHRGQYCSTRTLPDTKEPVLFCDFYSDLQIRLQSKEVDIDGLEREVIRTSNAILQKLSNDFQTQFNFDKIMNHGNDF